MIRLTPRAIAVAALSALLAGGAYLYAVRGAAMMLDLSAMVQGLLCF